MKVQILSIANKSHIVKDKIIFLISNHWIIPACNDEAGKSAACVM